MRPHALPQLAAIVAIAFLLSCSSIEIPTGDPVVETRTKYLTVLHPESLDPARLDRLDKYFSKLCDANDAWSLCSGMIEQRTEITLMSCQRMALRFTGNPNTRIWGLTINRALPNQDGPGVDIYLCSLDKSDVLHELAHGLEIQSRMGYPFFPSAQMLEAFAHGLQDVALDGPHITWHQTR